MYKSYYQFKENPFSLLPDPSFLFLGKKHQHALTMLQYGLVKNSGYTVITGEIGAGKTTLVRRLLDGLENELTVGLINNTHQSFGELLRWVSMAFGLDYKGKDKVELTEHFLNFIIDEYTKKRRTVLIIDEAQNLSAQALEELRMLSNLNADKHQALQLILIGQPELRQTLHQPNLKQFTQRISVAYHLETLDQEETVLYIKHRIKTAGGDENLFDRDACLMVWQNSNGIPRIINTLCDTALVYGFAEDKAHIDTQVIANVVKEREQGGVFVWYVPEKDEN